MPGENGTACAPATSSGWIESVSGLLKRPEFIIATTVCPNSSGWSSPKAWPNSCRATRLKSLKKDPAQFESNYHLGRMEKKAHRFTPAIQHLEAARAAYPRMVFRDNPYALLAEMYRENMEKEKALSVLADYLKIRFSDLDTALRVAAGYLKLKDYAKARHWAREVVFINPYHTAPDDADAKTRAAHLILGDALLGLKQWKEAEQAYRVAGLLNPRSADARAGRGRAALRQGKVEQAKALARAALEIDRQHAVARKLLQEVDDPKED